GGVRLLPERQPAGRSSAVDAGARTPHRRVPASSDPDVQRLRGSGRELVRGPGSQEELLVWRRGPSARGGAAFDPSRCSAALGAPPALGRAGRSPDEYAGFRSRVTMAPTSAVRF